MMRMWFTFFVCWLVGHKWKEEHWRASLHPHYVATMFPVLICDRCGEIKLPEV